MCFSLTQMKTFSASDQCPRRRPADQRTTVLRALYIRGCTEENQGIPDPRDVEGTVSHEWRDEYWRVSGVPPTVERHSVQLLSTAPSDRANCWVCTHVVYKYCHCYFFETLRLCLHDTVSSFVRVRLHPGYILSIYIRLHDTGSSFIPAWLHPGSILRLYIGVHDSF